MKQRINIALPCLLVLALLLLGMCEAQDWRSEDSHENVILTEPPFLCSSEKIRLESEMDDTEDNDTTGRVFRSGAAAEDRERDYRPIRILVSSEDVDDPTKYCTEEGGLASNFAGGTEVCEEEDILTGFARRMFFEVTFPIGKEKHESHLMVRRSLVRMKNSECGVFTVPSSHSDPGFLNIDFIAYVGVGKDPVTAAWGGPCGTFQGRDAFGRLFFNTFFGTPDSDNVMVHELGHASGMGKGPYGKQIELRENPYVAVSAGKHARQRAHLQYNWSTTPGPEYEGRDPVGTDPPVDEQTTSYVHWLARNLGGEYMSCLGACDYGQVGMGLYRDLEVYRVRYERAVFMPMAYQQGPDHHEKKCAIDGIPQADSFCGIEDRDYCNYDRAVGYGPCNIVVSDTAIPSYAQYFSDPSLMGTSGMLGDVCPFQKTVKNCKSASSWVMPGSIGGSMGYCLNTNYTEEGERLTVGSSEVSAICALINCDIRQLTYQVLFYGERHFMPCPQLEVLDMSKYTEEFTDGQLQCPLYYSVCGREDFNAKNAAVPSALVASKHGVLFIGIVVATVLAFL